MDRFKKLKFVAFVIANPYFSVIVGAVVLLLIVFAYIKYVNMPSATEKELQDLNNQAVEQAPVEARKEAQSQQKEVDAREVEKDSNEKVKKAKEARNANVTNSTYEEANRNRCIAYPEDPGCKK